VVIRELCELEAPGNPYADQRVTFCLERWWITALAAATTVPVGFPSDAERILALVKDKPTTLYIYPESTDIVAVARAVKAGRSLSRAGLYWNPSCVREIGSPNFWPRETLEPVLVQYKKLHPPSPPQPPPICRQ
jgi:hypothetical protein